MISAGHKFYFLAGLNILLSFFICSPTFSQNTYVNQYKGLAIELSVEYGIPSKVILGVAIVESGSGRSRNSKLLNNHFGIVGKNNLLQTNNIKSRYKQYPDVKASYIDFCKVISRKKYYPRLKGESNIDRWVSAIASAGYSEVPDEWKRRVLAAIKKIDY